MKSHWLSESALASHRRPCTADEGMTGVDIKARQDQFDVVEA